MSANRKAGHSEIAGRLPVGARRNSPSATQRPVPGFTSLPAPAHVIRSLRAELSASIARNNAERAQKVAIYLLGRRKKVPGGMMRRRLSSLSPFCDSARSLEAAGDRRICKSRLVLCENCGVKLSAVQIWKFIEQLSVNAGIDDGFVGMFRFALDDLVL